MKFLWITLAFLLIMPTHHCWAALPNPCEILLTKALFQEALDDWKENGEQAIPLDALVELASTHLDSQQTTHVFAQTADGYPEIKILPDRKSKSRLNQIAAAIWDKHHTELVYDLKNLATRNAKGAYRAPRNGRPGIIFLPTLTILDVSWTNSTLAHEIMHSLTVWYLNRKQVSPFYGREFHYPFFGRVRSVYGDALPVDLSEIENLLKDVIDNTPVRNNYEIYFAFDEINAYYAQIKLLLGAKTFKKEIARSRAMRGFKLAHQTVHLTKKLLTALRRKTAKRNAEKIYVTIDGVELEFEFPLVKTSSELKTQIKLLQTAALIKREQFQKMLQSISKK